MICWLSGERRCPLGYMFKYFSKFLCLRPSRFCRLYTFWLTFDMAIVRLTEVLFYVYWFCHVNRSQTKKIYSHASLLFCNNQANAAGRAYQTLFKQTWRTHETRTLTNHNPVNIRGFKGDYTINVKKNGHVIETENFTLGDSGTSLELHLPSHGMLYFLRFLLRFFTAVK